jgi:hypothetical protein
MMKYYEVVVLITNESEDSKGNVKVKRVKETYLVDAMSVTEAEARIVKLFSHFSQDYSVISVRGSKILEVVSKEDKENEKLTRFAKKQETEKTEKND